MKFRTEYEARPGAFLLNPEEPALLLGSCFSENIGARMRTCRWQAVSNPCGALYNPRSISNILRSSCRWEGVFKEIEDSLAQRDNLWVSWLTDSGSTTSVKHETRQTAFRRLLTVRQCLAETKTLIITFGSAWIYELRERPGYVVSNCHKFPSDTFARRRLTIEEIVNDWRELLALIKEQYPELKIIFTVSPVRHLKDGFEGNSRSKAILQLACEEICVLQEDVCYFPAFEIVNDDLRDYRFYASDMVHPSADAVEYIWEKFQQTFLTEAARRILREGEKVTKRLNHRPIINPNTQWPQSNE